MNARAIAVSLLSLTVTVIFGTAALAGDGTVRHTATRHVANSYIVVLRDDVDADAVGAELGSKHAVKVTGTVRVLLKAFEINATESQAKAISAESAGAIRRGQRDRDRHQRSVTCPVVGVGSHRSGHSSAG